jgi:hypothetical protein
MVIVPPVAELPPVAGGRPVAGVSAVVGVSTVVGVPPVAGVLSADTLAWALPVELAMTLPLVLLELGGAVDGAVAGPPAEHALSTAAAARPRIGTVRRATFIDVLRWGQAVGRMADRGGRNE